MRAPSNRISPALPRLRPEIVRTRVDLPAPLGPTSDLPEDHFEDKLDRGFSILRVLNYPELLEEPEEGQLRAGEHSDYDNLTICLIEDKPGGLQARGPDGAWIDVPVVAGSFVVNIGDMVMRWTNDRWKSTRHRVVNPPRATGDRLSVCHFVMPNHDAVIECLPTCQSPERPAKYPPIVAGDYMVEKFSSQASGKEWSDEDSRRFGTADTESRFFLSR